MRGGRYIHDFYDPNNKKGVPAMILFLANRPFNLIVCLFFCAQTAFWS